MKEFEKRIDEAFDRLKRMEEEVYDNDKFFFPLKEEPIMKKNLFIVNVSKFYTSAYGEPGEQYPVKSMVVSLKETTRKYKMAVLKKIAAPYTTAWNGEEEFEEKFLEFGNKISLMSEWECGCSGNELYAYKVELMPLGEVIEY